MRAMTAYERSRILRRAAEIMAGRVEELGRTIDVILDQPVAGERNVWVGRSHAEVRVPRALLALRCRA